MEIYIRKTENELIVIPNYGVYPTHQEIDEIINWFKELRTSNTNDEIVEHNRGVNERFFNELTDIKTTTKRIKTAGYIYVLKSRDLHKIGRAKNIKTRLNIYKTENPFGIDLIVQKKVDDCVGVERQLLNKFKKKRVVGEWFNLDDNDIDKIKKQLCQE